MRITVRYYASVRDKLGEAEEEFELPRGSDGGALTRQIAERYPLLKEYLPFLRLATDSAYISLEETLEEGMVINVIPPVSGG